MDNQANNNSALTCSVIQYYYVLYLGLLKFIVSDVDATWNVITLSSERFKPPLRFTFHFVIERDCICWFCVSAQCTVAFEVFDKIAWGFGLAHSVCI